MDTNENIYGGWTCFDVAQARINILGGSIDVMHKGREMELLLTFIDKVEINHESRSKSMMPIFRVKAKELPEKVCGST
ncbi:MAG: hypothetical protein IPK35_00030 [Saprospiraceae bacterium]|nr:hypothetical protein [Saprospiraceae bacterium]